MPDARAQMPIPIHLSKNLLSGLLFVGFGLFGLWLARDLDAGTASDMGPAYFPRLVCTTLALLGSGLVVSGFVTRDEAPEGWAWRPFLLITLAALAFALLLRPVGLIGTIAITTVLASASGAMLRPLQLGVLVAVLIALNVGVFIVLLRMPIPLWPVH